jgi:hypothetical protein
MINIRLHEQYTKHDPKANLIHTIKISGSENILLLNNKDEPQDCILYEYFGRSTLDSHVYAKRVILENNCEEVLTSLIFKLINYFTAKGYRLTRSYQGHGGEQIQFLKMKIEEEFK